MTATNRPQMIPETTNEWKIAPTLRAALTWKAALLYAVMLLVTFGIDPQLRHLLTRLPAEAPYLRIFTELGNGGVDFALSLLLLALHRPAGKAALGAFVTGGIAVNLLKYTIGRARPYTLASHWLFIGPTTHGNYGSFPSGHTTTVFALATVVAAAYPRLAVPVYTLATLIGLSRVTSGMHWPSDVLGGAILGTLVAILWIQRVRWAPVVGRDGTTNQASVAE